MKRLVLILFCCVSISELHAQKISPLISFEFGSPLFFNRDAGVLNQFGTDSPDTSSCYSYGIGADVRWSKLIGSVGFASNLQFIYSTGRFNFEQARATVTGIDRKLRLELFAFESFGRFSIRVGGWASQRLSANVIERDSAHNDITPIDSTSEKFHVGPALGIEYLFHNLRMALGSNFDVTSKAGPNALGVGLSLAYVFPRDENVPSSENASILQNPHSNSPTIRFLVNRSQLMRTVPLERVETHVQGYHADSTGVTAARSIVESYHLPHLALVAELGGGDSCSITISNGRTEMFNGEDRAVLGRGLAKDTIDLDAEPGFQRALVSLSIHKRNTLVAEIRSAFQNGSAVDSLVIPSVDTAHLTSTIVRNQARFVFPIRLSGVLRDSLIAQLRSWVQVHNDIKEHATILQSAADASSAKDDLLRNITNALGTAANNAEYQVLPSELNEVTVVLDY